MTHRSLRIGNLIAIAALSLTCVAVSVTSAHAVAQTFDLTWSGAPFGNSASATGTAVIDDSLFTTSGYQQNDLPDLGFESLSITVTGASAGNGTFTESDFSGGAFWGNGATFDLSQDLVGQATSGGAWGTPDGNSGDFEFFNFAASPAAPNGTSYFILTTDASTGDNLLLTHFVAASPLGTVAPESNSLVLLGLALPLAGLILFRRKTAAKSAPAI